MGLVGWFAHSLSVLFFFAFLCRFFFVFTGFLKMKAIPVSFPVAFLWMLTTLELGYVLYCHSCEARRFFFAFIDEKKIRKPESWFQQVRWLK